MLGKIVFGALSTNSKICLQSDFFTILSVMDGSSKKVYTVGEIEGKRKAAEKKKAEVLLKKECRSLTNWLVATVVKKEKDEQRKEKLEEWKQAGQKTFENMKLDDSSNDFLMDFCGKFETGKYLC